MPTTLISLSAIVDAIGEAAAIILDNDVLLYASLADLTGDPDNEWMALSWTDEDGEYCVKFTEQGASEAWINDEGDIVVRDSEGEETQITLLARRSMALPRSAVDAFHRAAV